MRSLTIALVCFACLSDALAHDITTRVTWNREISRIVYARCISCHRAGGDAFSLVTFQEAQPWANVIKESVLTRRMPPWGAVKGFGRFRNEEALATEEMNLFAMWVNGGTPEGNPDHLPARPNIPPNIPPRSAMTARHDELVVGDHYTFSSAFVLDGFFVRDPPKSVSAQITIRFPDGRIEPLVWLDHYQPRRDPFLLLAPLTIPSGAQLQGLVGGKLALLPIAKNAR